MAKACELAFPIVLSYFRANDQLEVWRRGGSHSREGERAMSGPENTPPGDNKDWQGFREIDRAIAENRVTSYTWKKTWADPWGRLKLILIFAGLFAFVAFVIVYDLVL